MSETGEFELARIAKIIATLRERLIIDGGEPQYKDCCDYSDQLVVDGEPKFDDLSRLEWMLRTAALKRNNCNKT